MKLSEITAEMRRVAEAARPFIGHGCTMPASAPVFAADLLAVLDRLADVESRLGQVESYCATFVEGSIDYDAMEPKPWNPAAYVLDIVAPGTLAELLADR